MDDVFITALDVDSEEAKLALDKSTACRITGRSLVTIANALAFAGANGFDSRHGDTNELQEKAIAAFCRLANRQIPTALERWSGPTFCLAADEAKPPIAEMLPVALPKLEEDDEQVVHSMGRTYVWHRTDKDGRARGKPEWTLSSATVDETEGGERDGSGG